MLTTDRRCRMGVAYRLVPRRLPQRKYYDSGLMFRIVGAMQDRGSERL
jgi:hypothetical protein